MLITFYDKYITFINNLYFCIKENMMAQMVISVSINPRQHKKLVSYIEFLMRNKEITKAKACRYLMLKGLEKMEENHLKDAHSTNTIISEEDI